MPKSFIVAALLICGVTVATQASATPKLSRYIAGDPADVSIVMHGPALDLSGGAADVDAAFQATIDLIRGCTGTCATKIDIVVLDARGKGGYGYLVQAMNGVDSVETLVFGARESAFNPAVVAAIQNAEFIFFDGGDQCDYVTYFKGTPVETAVRDVYARGGGVGGISAGLAIQGSTVYDACTSKKGVTSSQALANPYDPNISFTHDFLAAPQLTNLITDSHFVARDRMGRLMAFVARQIPDGIWWSQWGLGVNEGTSVVVDKNGVATVMGAGPAYLVYADHAPTVCVPGLPLGYSDYKVWKYSAGDTFNLTTRPTTGYSLISVDNGVLSGNPY